MRIGRRGGWSGTARDELRRRCIWVCGSEVEREMFLRARSGVRQHAVYMGLSFLPRSYFERDDEIPCFKDVDRRQCDEMQ